MEKVLKYHPGFCNEICSEALPHALPKGQVCATHCTVACNSTYVCVCALRTTLKCVPMACIVSSCPGRPSPVPEVPTGEGKAVWLHFELGSPIHALTHAHSWLYRIRPSVMHQPFQPRAHSTLIADFSKCPPNPNQVSSHLVHVAV